MADIIKCELCKQTLKYDSFRNNVSRKEYFISGMCQECQDKTFYDKDLDFNLWVKDLYEIFMHKK